MVQRRSIYREGSFVSPPSVDVSESMVWYDGRAHIPHLDMLANARSISPTNEMLSHESLDYRTTLLEGMSLCHFVRAHALFCSILYPFCALSPIILIIYPHCLLLKPA